MTEAGLGPLRMMLMQARFRPQKSPDPPQYHLVSGPLPRCPPLSSRCGVHFVSQALFGIGLTFALGTLAGAR